MSLFVFLLVVLSIENLTDLLVNVDLLEEKRFQFETSYPSWSKLARCRFCQSFWLSGFAALVLPSLTTIGSDPFSKIFEVALTWLVMHKAVLIVAEAFERFLGRAPSSHVATVYVKQDINESKSDSL